VLSGGTSSEREVSLRSGEAVVGALRVAADSGAWEGTVTSVVIEEDGTWNTPDGRLKELDALRDLGAEHVVFIALHGGRGEDGRLQAVLESAGVRYTGSGPSASALCMDKRAARGVLLDEGLNVPPGLLVPRLLSGDTDQARLQRELEELSPNGDGWFVKPNKGGSSAGVTRVMEPGGLLAAISTVLESGDSALVERLIRGVEVSVGVIGVLGRDLRALPTVEIQPQGSDWFDEAEKYAASGAVEVCPPENIPHSVDEDLRRSALRAHVATGCRGHSRTDFMVTEGGDIYALEVNTIPGLTERSLLPLEAAAAGMNFQSLCLEMLRLASSDA